MVMTSLIFINNEYPLPIDADNCIKKMYLVDRDHIFYMQTVERISDDDHRKEILTFNNGEHLSFFSLKY